MKITAIGELLIDFTPLNDINGYPSFNALPGGAPCNFLAACSECGNESSFIGKVGNDAFGKMLINVLEENNINTSGIVIDDSVFTTLAFVTLNENGDRSFSFARKPGADTCLKSGEIDYTLIDNCDVFHFGTLSFTDEPSKSAVTCAVKYAKQRGKIISFDPNYRDKLWKNENDAREAIKLGLQFADIVKISDDEVKFTFGLSPEEGAELIVKNYGVSVAVVTCGKKGCVYAFGYTVGFIANYEKVNTIDTTGAGDIFGGYFVSTVTNKCDIRNLSERDVRNACITACTAASLSTEKHGGISSVPSYSDVIKHIN